MPAPRKTVPLRLSAAFVALCLCLLAAPGWSGGAGIGWDNSIAVRKGKARTVDELARMYDSRHCGDCHAEIYREWQLSAHSEPIIGKRRVGRKALAILQIFEFAKEKWAYSGLTGPSDIRVEHLTGCTRCHLPQLADAEDDVARELVADFLRWQDAARNGDNTAVRDVEVKLSELTVNCLICHNRNAVVHKWTDGYPASREVYGKKSGSHPCGSFPTLKRSPIMGEALLCGQCHGAGALLGRDNPTQCPTAYGYYLFDYQVVGGDETCQDCHMRKTKLGHNIQSYRDPAMIKEAIDFSVDVSRLPRYAAAAVPGSVSAPLPRIAVNIAITNKAGHPIPDGCPTVARLLLEITAKSGNGSEIFFEEKSYMPIAQNDARGDRMGRGPFEKNGMIIDTSLLPLTTVEERYDIPVSDKEKEAEITVRLTYLPFGTLKPSDSPTLWREVVRKVSLQDFD